MNGTHLLNCLFCWPMKATCFSRFQNRACGAHTCGRRPRTLEVPTAPFLEDDVEKLPSRMWVWTPSLAHQGEPDFLEGLSREQENRSASLTEACTWYSSAPVPEARAKWKLCGKTKVLKLPTFLEIKQTFQKQVRFICPIVNQFGWLLLEKAGWRERNEGVEIPRNSGYGNWGCITRAVSMGWGKGYSNKWGGPQQFYPWDKGNLGLTVHKNNSRPGAVVHVYFQHSGHWGRRLTVSSRWPWAT